MIQPIISNIIYADFWDYFTNMSPWQLVSLGLGLATVVLIVAYILVASNYRSRRLKTHSMYINLEGGSFQGSDEKLIFTAKLGKEIDIARIKPVKDGFHFNGFNVYKRYISSKISDKGIARSTMTEEELDGENKDVIEMPDYDLYLVAKYSPIDTKASLGLKEDKYYPDYICLEDVIANLKHLNDDKAAYPVRIKFCHYSLKPEMVFVFKKDTILAMIQPFGAITKVFLRTSKKLDELLLNPFYQAEDINDSLNWYSFVIVYNTKPSRIIRSFKESYDDIESSEPTSEIEFGLICGSLSEFADPIVDRAKYIVDQYEKDKSLPNLPDYVSIRDFPTDFEIKLAHKPHEKEEKTSDEFTIGERPNTAVETTNAATDTNDSDAEPHQANVTPAAEAKTDVDKNATDEGKIKEENNKEAEALIKKEPETKDEKAEGKIEEKANDIVQNDESSKDADKEEPASADQKAIQEYEAKIVKAPLGYNRSKLVGFITANCDSDAALISRGKTFNRPWSLKIVNKTYAMIYENNAGLVRIVLRLDPQVAALLKEKHSSFVNAKFPAGPEWFMFYLDDSFVSNDELKDIFAKSRAYVRQVCQKSLLDKKSKDKSAPIE